MGWIQRPNALQQSCCEQLESVKFRLLVHVCGVEEAQLLSSPHRLPSGIHDIEEKEIRTDTGENEGC
jgi:hypothetical protein